MILEESKGLVFLGGVEDMNGEVMGSECRERMGQMLCGFKNLTSVMQEIVPKLRSGEKRISKDFKLLMLPTLCFGMVSYGRYNKKYKGNAGRCLCLQRESNSNIQGKADDVLDQHSNGKSREEQIDSTDIYYLRMMQ